MTNTDDSINIGGLIIHKSDNGLYSLVDLWKASGSDDKDKPAKWLRTATTQRYINHLKNEVHLCPSFESQVLKINKGKKEFHGTYVSKKLVYRYAMWINDYFYDLVVDTFDALVRAQTVKEVMHVKKQNDLYNSEMIDFSHREPTHEHALSVILKIASNESKPYFDYLVEIGELTKKMIPQLDKAEYFPTENSKYVIGRKGKTILFDKEVANAFPKQDAIFEVQS